VSIRQAYQDLDDLWSEISRALHTGDYTQASYLLYMLCPLCLHYQSNALTCPLPIIHVRFDGRDCSICTCEPSTNAIRWRLATIINRFIKRYKCGMQDDVEEVIKMIDSAREQLKGVFDWTK